MRAFDAVIRENSQLKAGIFDLWLETGNVMEAVPGQFINVYLDRPDLLLPRPISICDMEGNRIRLVYQVSGKGTEYLSRQKRGKQIRVVGPLGDGFRFQDKREGKALMIGGGIGVPPLLFLAKRLGPCRVVLGFRSASATVLIDEFLSLGCETVISTDDGSLGYKGRVMEAVKALVKKEDISSIYACGPRIMLKGAAEYAGDNGIPCQVSMEEHMGCGIGACLCCPVSVIKNGVKSYKKVCKDGPVFAAASIDWGDSR